MSWLGEGWLVEMKVKCLVLSVETSMNTGRVAGIRTLVAEL